MSIRMRPAPTAGVNGRNAGGGGPVAGGGRDGPGTPGESRMQQYMRRVLEAGQRGDRLETSPPAPSDPSPAPNPAVKRKASVRDDGTDDDDDRGSVDERTEPSIASVVDAFAATVMTGGTLIVHEWHRAASSARAGQKRVGIYSGKNQFETPHENVQFLMKLALKDALNTQLYNPNVKSDWTRVADELQQWQQRVGVGTNTSQFQDLDTDNGRNWEKLDHLIHALCVLMQTSVVVADHLAGNGESTETVANAAPTPNATRFFVATDAWRGARDGYDTLEPAPPNVPAFEPGSRLNAYIKLRGMNMQHQLTMDHEPYVWLGLFLRYRITATDVDRGFSPEVCTLLTSIGKHFLTSYASAECAPNYELPPEQGFTYDSSVTGEFEHMPTVEHGFQWPLYDQEAWDRAAAQSNQTEWGGMGEDLALTQSFVDSYNHTDANVFDPVKHLTIVYEVSAEDPNESDNESGNDSDATDED